MGDITYIATWEGWAYLTTSSTWPADRWSVGTRLIGDLSLTANLNGYVKLVNWPLELGAVSWFGVTRFNFTGKPTIRRQEVTQAV